MAEGDSRAIDDTLFSWPSDDPALLGSTCQRCGEVAFPVTGACAACGSTQMTTIRLPQTGELWTWTIQRFEPKSPYRSDETGPEFRPFGVGYVQLGDKIRVESRLIQTDPSQLHIGMSLKLVIYPQYTDPDGTAVMNYGFGPT